MILLFVRSYSGLVTGPDNIAKYRVQRNDLQLFIIDVQERLVAAMSEGPEVVANVGHLVAMCNLLSIPVVVTEQYRRGLGGTVPPIAEAVQGLDPVDKLEFSCLDNEEVCSRLSSPGRRQVAVVGMEAHICVLQTCLDLLARGYTVHVVKDAVCSRSPHNKATALEMMRDAGAVITTAETLLFQVLGKAGTDEFRAISKRIR